MKSKKDPDLPEESKVVEDLQKNITNGLYNKELYPFSVIVTFAFKDVRCYITFFDSNMLTDFLEFIEYKYLCQKDSFLIVEKTNTVAILDLLAVRILIDKLCQF